MEDSNKKMTITDLNSLYDEAKQVDKEMFSKMRSAILLIAGEHYSKRMEAFWNRQKNAASNSDSYKIKITKNWIHRAHRLYVSSILSKAPGSAVSPRNKLELQDQKDAELNQSVWEYLKSICKIKAHTRDACGDFTGVGECATKVYFDKNKGYLKGYEQKLDEMGQPLLDESGQPVEDRRKPVFSGQFVFERIYPHTLFRHPSAKKMEDSPFLGIEKMVDSKELRRKYKSDPEKLKFIEDSQEEFVVFDANKSSYGKESTQTLVKEYYFKPSEIHPKGYFYHTTKAGILEEGELPGEKFPIVWKGFDEAPTRARATGMVEIARPFQAELNRAASQCAMNSITMSDDKMLYQSGSKLASGSLLPGVRGISYTGTPPMILSGRSGDQFYQYIQIQEQEMNRALLLDVLDAEKINQLDPYAMMYRSMVQSQHFSIYSDKFGEWLVELCELTLELAKFYLPDDEVIAAVGKSESINMAEFRKTTPLCHRIHVQEQEETVESRLGKQLTMNQIMQYAGSQLTREDIGKLITNMPFGNWQEQFADFTVDERNVKNDFLAIERGEQPRISPTDSSEYVLKKVASRKKERDYSLLAPEIQALYDSYEQVHIQKVQAEGEAAKAASSEFIPSGGAMIATDMYLPDADPAKAPKRARIPYQSLDWLLSTLSKQGMAQEKLEAMNDSQVMAMQAQGQSSSQPPSQEALNAQAEQGAIQ